MREIIMIIIIVIVIFAGDFLTQSYLETSVNEMKLELETLKIEALKCKESDERSTLENQFNKTEEKWNKINSVWSIIIIHEEIDNIEESLIKAKSSIFDGQLEEALEEIETAMFYINHVREREKIELKNIF